jgi:hypothetical protein
LIDGGSFLAVDPVAGCKTIAPGVIVYDRPEVREIGFPSLFSTYTADLAEAVRRDGALVELRGIDMSMGKGECPVNLIWARPS